MFVLKPSEDKDLNLIIYVYPEYKIAFRVIFLFLFCLPETMVCILTHLHVDNCGRSYREFSKDILIPQIWNGKFKRSQAPGGRCVTLDT